MRTSPTLASLAALMAGVSCSGTSEQRPEPTSSAEADAISLAAPSAAFAELEIPPETRPGGAQPLERIPLNGSWRYIGTTKRGMHKYETEIPIRPRGLFFHRAQPGMALRDESGATIKYDRFGYSKKPMWSHDRDKLIVYLPERSGPPAKGAYLLSYPRAVEREKALNFSMSGVDEAADFVRTQITDDWDARSGLLLPAPATAAWDLTLPPAAELHMVPGITAPEVLDGEPSDGARLVVEVDVDGKTHTAHTQDLEVATFEMRRVDLSAWSGKDVRLRVRTEPGASGNADFDYVFIGEPVVASHEENPVTVLMVFIDTLRPDHMSLYGYHRDTTAAIDGLADRAALFTDARSVAPWTLPSARTAVTGRHPEYYDATPTLQSRLSAEGWATGMIAGNVYLSANFGMTRDWDFHRVGLWPMAEEVTDDAIAWLDDHQGRDGFLQVHYMDPHLPYTEPESYRFQYSQGEPRKGLRWEFHLSDVRRARPDDEDTRDWIRGRYDNNVRYATDQVARLLERLDDNDWLILYSDHGEEFWEHSQFEHGHTLFDELLRVPLVVDGPGIDGGTFDVPASLLDITPTILEATGLSAEGLDGTSLLPVIRGDGATAEAIRARDLAFGRPLYGMHRWGVLHEGMKWTTTEGREALYDISKDRAEKNNLLLKDPDDKGAPYRDHLATALDREVAVGYRLVPTHYRGTPNKELKVGCVVPGGVAHAFVGDDPLELSSAEVGVDGDNVVAVWHRGYKGAREVYFEPKKPLEEVTHGLVCTAQLGEAVQTIEVNPQREPGLGALRIPLGRARFKERTALLTFGFAPVPDDETQLLQATDPEMQEWMKALGYAEDDSEGSAQEGGEGTGETGEGAPP